MACCGESLSLVRKQTHRRSLSGESQSYLVIQIFTALNAAMSVDTPMSMFILGY